MAERKLTSKVLTWRASIAESALPRTTRAVAWALANYMNERGESAFPGVPRLAGDVGNERGDGPASKSTVIAALRALQEAGYLERVTIGGGRARRGEWNARLPDTVQQLNPLPGSAGSSSRPGSPALSGAGEGSDALSGEVSAPAERVQQLDRIPGSERVQSQHERVQSALVNGSAAEPEVEVLEVDQEVEQQQPRARARDDAAAAVALRFDELRIVGDARELALADPERALAWLELAATEATRNPAAFVRQGVLSSAWPSPRIAPPASPDRLEPKKASIANLVETGVDAAEIRYFIDVEWETLADVERAELHEYLADVLAGDEEEPALPRAELRAVDAA